MTDTTKAQEKSEAEKYALSEWPDDDQYSFAENAKTQRFWIAEHFKAGYAAGLKAGEVEGARSLAKRMHEVFVKNMAIDWSVEGIMTEWKARCGDTLLDRVKVAERETNAWMKKHNQTGFVLILFLIGAALGSLLGHAAVRAHEINSRFESSEHFTSVEK